MNSMVSVSTRWSVYAGIYTFLAGAGLLMPLGVIAGTLVEILGLPTGFTAVLVPGSGTVIGAVVWWVVIEHRNNYTYLLGGTVGLLTALVTVLWWALVVAILYGLSGVLVAGVVILFVLVIVGPLAFIA
jgi:hypothetical protein